MSPGEGYVFPLSFAQERLWFLDRFEPDSSLYNLPSAYRIEGKLDLKALEESINRIVERHEALRTTFREIEGLPRQVVPVEKKIVLQVIDLEGDDEEKYERATRILDEHAQRPFQLSTGPLIRTMVITLAARDHVFFINMHHIISDAWSMGVFWNELSACYRALSGGEEPVLPDLKIQYADYTQWQREWLKGEELNKQLAYWKDLLRDSPDLLDLPTDRPRLSVQSYHGDKVDFRIPGDVYRSLRELSRREGVTLNMTLLSGFAAMLYRYTGQENIPVGTPIAGRNRVELENLIGFFVNTLVIMADMDGDPTFREVIGRIKETATGAYAHQDLPFEKLVAEMEPERDTSHTPLFQVMFDMQQSSSAGGEYPELGDCRVTPVAITVRTSKFDLNMVVKERGETLAGSIIFNTDLFDLPTIRRMAGHYRRILESISSDPDIPVSLVPLLTGEERKEIICRWNDTGTSYPAQSCIHELFQRIAARTPESTALTFGDTRISYSRLNRWSNRIAHYLRGRGVGPEVPVGICMERSPLLVAAVLGVLKAGGLYLPLDPGYPARRLKYIIEDAGAGLILAGDDGGESLPRDSVEIITVQPGSEPFPEERDDEQENLNIPDNLAYLMYTSGSTGRPRGVQVTHRNVVRLVKGAGYASMEEVDTFLMFAPLSFDASTFEIWAPLLNGAGLVIMPAGMVSIEKLGAAIREYGVTVLWLTAGLFHQVVERAAGYLSGVKQLITGGDVLSVSKVKRFLRLNDNCELVNGYGPTESTTFATCYRMNSPAQVGNSVSIGKPIDNTTVYLLDRNYQPVPVGVPGEIYIGGDGVARGYRGDSSLTPERFIPDPFGRDGARLFRSGDLARYLPDGNIEFLGREDYQVKIRGFRIELGEIERIMSEHPGVSGIIAVAREDDRGEKQLTAYILPDNEREPGVDELRRWAGENLPDFMVPSSWVMMESFPLTPRGKVDRNSLPPPGKERPEMEEDYVVPDSPAEKKLALIWREILDVERIGIRDNFFDLGGNSLLATQLVSRIREEFQIELELKKLFQDPTISGLAAVMEEGEKKESEEDKIARTLEKMEDISDREAEEMIRDEEENQT